MTSFIHDVLLDLKKQNYNLSELTFILPSKRAGHFLKQELSKLTTQTIFSPSILSIETFIEELSGLSQISNTELLFKFYDIYSKNTLEKDLESFQNVSKWAQILLQDFNEIDRYLIPHKKIFSYLNAIQESNHWSLQEEQTPLVKRYLSFWKKLNHYYLEFTTLLINEKTGYQGLLYREAVENIESYCQTHHNTQHVFLGFNALNTAESTIIKELLQHQIAKIYWDIDSTIYNAKHHNAGLFMKLYKKQWSYFFHHDFNWIHNHYNSNKSITSVGVPKNIGQAKYIGTLLNDLKNDNPNLNNTAVVLGDENLLIPVLNSIPDHINSINITMGYPLNTTPLASLFDQLFQIQIKYNKAFYYKDVISILSHPFIKPLFLNDEIDIAFNIIDYIKKNNILFISPEQLKELSKSKHNETLAIFHFWNDDCKTALSSLSQIVMRIKNALSTNKSNNLLALEYLYHFNVVFNHLIRLNNEYDHIKDIKGLFTIYKEILSYESLDFQGEPLEGLQIMGMLESRVLDFETVIISSVNEGILPSGKSHNSFIPFDVKIEHHLPTYKEKDAIYTYHFYRLLQRAKHIYLIYNTEPDDSNANEKSRFITQLEIENIHKINSITVASKTPKIELVKESISKNHDVLNKIKTIAEKGFSPSSLTSYIRNPIDFYYQKVLGIKEYDNVEELLAANTIGTIIHNTLEDLYKPLEGHFLSIKSLDKMQLQIDNIVMHHFKETYKEGLINTGKNLITFEVIKRYINNFIKLEKQIISQGNHIKIVSIETDLKVTIPIDDLDFPVNLVGKVDRVDEYNGTLRVIDYKTGKVFQSQVEIIDWEAINTDYEKYSKSFQVLAYTYMMNQHSSFKNPIEAGIISFKNLSNGFLKFAKKESIRGKKKHQITQDTLYEFYLQLKDLILDICNPDTHFIEKDV